MLNQIVYEGNHSKITKLFEGVYFREGNLEVRDQCNSGIVCLNGSCAVIDLPAQNPDQEIIEEAEMITGLPVRYLLITHAHVDHVMGLKTLHRKDICLVTRKNSIEQLYREGYPVPNEYMAIENTMDLELDGRLFQLTVPARTAHSPWDMLIGIPEFKIVFTGDLVALHKNMFFHSSDIKGWREAIDHLIETKWDFILRGHGGIVERKYLSRTARYLALLDKAREWQMEHNEKVTAENILQNMDTLSPELSNIIQKLLEDADATNIARQINQLFYKV
jgi:glyoxylase-like metal-dependent hydrolase (beta-lactamase superfamily II)